LTNASLPLGGSYFNEDRNNGTPLQENSTEAGYVAAGGQQHIVGIFAQDIFRPLPQLRITGALRFDYWQNGDASRTDLNVVTGQITKTPFADRSDTAVSPRFAILYRATDSLVLRASA
jgi:outer membrane receptor protein involved in Fe transport